MDIEEVKRRVKKIAESATYNEEAHQLEDKLYQDFVRCVAASYGPECWRRLRAMAAEILNTGDVEFLRWYA